MARPQWLPLLDLLVCDPHNPRSVAFQLKGLHDFMRRIEEDYGDAIDERMDGALAALLGVDPGADLRHGSVRLAGLLQGWHEASARLSEQLGLRFFSHVGETSRQTFAM